MAMIKCKMCGGDLKLIEGASTAECEFCGSLQTIPVLDDEKKLVRFERAERLRKQCEFDKAAGIYETIVADYCQESEAYWGLVLCKYGIEYVDDPTTGKKIPTCHRSSFDSIMEDSDFEQALENADVMARRVYREEAKTIEEIRKGIISVSSSEQPYDIFICYKETSETGERTLDGVLAQDIYDILTEKGYRTFFARISLEDKLGREYEPYIFAALNSAKIMLAIGTDYEYYNAVWVKNEWSRFLKLMASDKSKHLIPCYKGIDAYDMPKEFARLQAQDLGKIGAMQDLLRGVEKLLPLKQPPAPAGSAGGVAGEFDIEDMLRKAQIHLKNQQWKNALESCKRIIAIDPENAWAYVYQLARTMRVTDPEDLGKCVNALSDSSYYTEALKYADPALAEKLQAWNASTLENSRLAEERCAPGRSKAQKARGLLAGGLNHTAAVLVDGTVITCGDNEYGQCETERWRDIIAVICGRNHTVGLRTDGTVSACGDNEKGQCDVQDWKNIIAIACDDDFTVGLCADGSVVSCGNDANGKRNLSDWTGIKAIACGYHHTVGQKADGTFVFTGSDRFGQDDVASWTDISYVAANNVQNLGLRKNGTVIACGNKDDDRIKVRLWRDIVDVSMGVVHSLGVKADGTVVACGSDNQRRCSDARQWTNIVSLARTYYHTLAIRADGTVMACGDTDCGKCETTGWKLFNSIETLEEERQEARLRRKLLDEQLQREQILQKLRRQNTAATVAAGEKHILLLECNGTVLARGNNEHHQCDVSIWKNIKAVACGEHYSLGLREDGTVVACGENKSGQCDVSGWRNIAAVACGYTHSVGLREDGTVVACGDNQLGQCAVADWKDVRAISCGYYHTVGLQKDGTVLVCGNNNHGQCNVGKWKNIVAIAAQNLHTVGLKANGTVVACGNNEYGQCDVTQWKDIVSISCGSHHSVGLRRDGTVVTCGYDASNRCSGTKGWTGIAGIVCGKWCTIGIPKKENIFLCGEFDDVNLRGLRPFGDIDMIQHDRALVAKNKTLLPRLCRNWESQISFVSKDILDEHGNLKELSAHTSPYIGIAHMQNLVCVASNHSIVAGLQKNGTMVFTTQYSPGNDAVECWEDIVRLQVGGTCIFGLRQDGTVVASGYNPDGRCNVSGWTQVKQLACSTTHTVGLLQNGTVVACGTNEFGECDTRQWNQVAQVYCGNCRTLGLRKDGTVTVCGMFQDRDIAQISRWNHITQLSVGLSHTVGLRDDGTVVACGDYKSGQCNVYGWRNIVAVAAGKDFTVGFTDCGTLVACGDGDGFAAKVHRKREAKAIVSDGYSVYILFADGTVCFPGGSEENCMITRRIYNSLSFLEEEKRVCIPTDPAERQRIRYHILHKQQTWRNAGLCQYCGAELKGFLGKKCSLCYRKKDY